LQIEGLEICSLFWIIYSKTCFRW